MFNSVFKKLLATVSAICIVFSMLFVTAYGDSPAANYGEKYNGYELIRGTTSTNVGNKKAVYYYSDGYFYDNSEEYNTHLAAMSSTVAMCSFDRTSSFAKAILANVGFTDVCEELTDATQNTVSVTLGRKTLNKGTSNECTVLAVSILSGYEINDVLSITKLGTSGNAQGLGNAASSVLTTVNSYISSKGINTSRLKIWVIGYAIGGGVGDICAKSFSDSFGAKNVYAYLFDAIAGASNQSAGGYKNIHIVNSYNNIFTLLLPAYLGFNYNGTVHYVGKDYGNGNFNTEESEMLKQLAAITTDNSYISPTTFTWAKIIADMDKIIDLIGGSTDYFSDIDSKHEQGNSMRECFELLISRVSKRALTSRSAYCSIPSDVKSAATKISVSNPYTIEEAIPAIVAFVNSLDEATLDALESNFKEFPIASNITKFSPIYSFITSFTFSSLTIRSYADLLNSVWNMLDKTYWLSDYEKISTILSSSQIAEVKRIAPIAIYTLAGYTSIDYSESKQTIGAILYNLDAIKSAAQPNITYAWVRFEDSYYANDTVAPQSSDASSLVEINLLAESKTSLLNTTVQLINSSNSVITVFENGVATSANINALNGTAYANGNGNCLSLILNKGTAYKLAIKYNTISENGQKITVSTRALNASTVSEAKDITVYKEQTAYISCKNKSDSSSWITIART